MHALAETHTHTHKAFKRLLCFTLLSFSYTHILSVSVSFSELLKQGIFHLRALKWLSGCSPLLSSSFTFCLSPLSQTYLQFPTNILSFKKLSVMLLLLLLSAPEVILVKIFQSDLQYGL